MIKIDRNIPIPEKGHFDGGHHRRRTKYPWAHMDIGDSFLVDYYDIPTSLRTGAYLAGKRLGFKFACREVDGGIRVWRVE